MSRFSTVVATAALVALTAGQAAAQEAASIVNSDAGYRPLAGWTFTPAMVYGLGYDDNVMVRGQGDDVRADTMNVLGPRADLSFLGRRSQFDANYAGGFSFYRDLTSLNTYAQNGSVRVRRLVSKHVALFAQNGFSASPTTALLELVGVPYVRTGSQTDTVRAGVEAQLTKRLSVNSAYDFQWVRFEQTPVNNAFLNGGHSHGGSAGLKYQIDPLTAVIADGNMQFANVNQGHDDFRTENISGGLERRLSSTFSVFAAGGISHLAGNNLGPARTGPAWRAGATKTFEQTTIDASYSRAYVPSFGFGGTTQNRSLSVHVLRPLSRRISATGGFSWQSNEPLTAGQPPLDAIWTQGNLAYALTQWLRIEGFYIGMHQTIDQPGGLVDRHQFGVQLVTAKPMRMQ